MVPADLPPEVEAAMRDTAAKAFRAVGCDAMARVDFFLMPDMTFVINELNTIPGFTETSVYGKLFEADGIPYAELCDRLVKLAIERHEKARSYEF
jgi:D-alanine-D-alanine ligase